MVTDDLTGLFFFFFLEPSELLPLATKHTAPPLQAPVQVQRAEVQIFIILVVFHVTNVTRRVVF